MFATVFMQAILEFTKINKKTVGNYKTILKNGAFAKFAKKWIEF